jgi:hypothetical protein
MASKEDESHESTVEVGESEEAPPPANGHRVEGDEESEEEVDDDEPADLEMVNTYDSEFYNPVKSPICGRNNRVRIW